MVRLVFSIALFIALFCLARADDDSHYKKWKHSKHHDTVTSTHSSKPCGKKHTKPVAPTPEPCGCHEKPVVPTVSYAPTPIVVSPEPVAPIVTPEPFESSSPAPTQYPIASHVPVHTPEPVAPSPAPVKPAVRQCRYKFCSGKTHFKIGKAADRSFTKSICDLDGKRIGTVDESGQAKLIVGSKLIDISEWTPYGLKQKFDPTFFKTFAIYDGKHAGVGHQTMQQNQKDFLEEKNCWILPFKAFQILDKYGNAKEKHTNDPKDCIKFCTTL